MMTREAFNNMFLKEVSHNYNNYELFSKYVLGLGVEGMTKEVKWAYYKCLESRLD